MSSTSSNLPVPGKSASCSCNNKDDQTCGCQAAHTCKCVPGTCTCENCPEHKADKGNSEACNCEGGCNCAPGKCEGATCPKSNKNKVKSCGCGEECTCPPGNCTCPNCPAKNAAE